MRFGSFRLKYIIFSVRRSSVSVWFIEASCSAAFLIRILPRSGTSANDPFGHCAYLKNIIQHFMGIAQDTCGMPCLSAMRSRHGQCFKERCMGVFKRIFSRLAKKIHLYHNADHCQIESGHSCIQALCVCFS